MKRFLVLTVISLLLTGCVAVPAYDNGYYYPYYGYYDYGPYGYWASDVNVFIAGPHRYHDFRGRGIQSRGFRDNDIRGRGEFRGERGVFRGGEGFRGRGEFHGRRR